MKRLLRRLLARHGVVRPAAPEPVVDVRRLIAELSDEDLLRSADDYFSQLTPDSIQFKKPFYDPSGAAPMAQNLGLLFEAGEFFRGARVLDFGCGTGWLSLGLAQVGCDVIGVDVSPAAVRLAEHLKATRHVASDGPLAFAAYDGRRLPLPDGCLDRIVCFDAFHHVRDQAATLREFARVLAEGGHVAFVEPGRHHSRTPQSQLEMSKYKVIENDIRMEEIAAIAAGCGLGEPQMFVQWPQPLALSLPTYLDWAERGVPWRNAIEMARTLRSDMINRSCFTLAKGQPRPDSRRAANLGGFIELQRFAPASTETGPAIRPTFTVRNTGPGRWLTDTESIGCVSIGCQLLAADGTVTQHGRLPLGSGEVAVGESRSVSSVVTLPPHGGHSLHFDLVSDHVAWFGLIGRSEPVTLDAAAIAAVLGRPT